MGPPRTSLRGPYSVVSLVVVACKLWPAAALVLRSSLDPSDSEAVQCPAFEQPDITALKERSKLGAVHAAPQGPFLHSTSSPLHLFLINLPNSGSSALASLVGSSPEATLLCAANERADEHCEGTWQLIRMGILSEDNRWDEAAPNFTWERAISAYEQYWDKTKSVRIDKSPPDAAKVEEIVKYFERSNKDVAFIILTHAACSPGHQGTEAHHDLEMLLHANASTGRFPKLVLQYEDIIRDPYVAAEKILRFAPDLLSLDPAVSGLHEVHADGDEREMSVLEYIFANAPFEAKTSTTRELWDMDEKLGYHH